MATISGLAPHVLHHLGILVGTALVSGFTGTVLFGVVGLVASGPFLLRLHKRFGSWHAPAIALVVFAVMFSLSAFVIGPRISGATSGPAGTPPPVDHKQHHGGVMPTVPNAAQARKALVHLPTDDSTE